MYRPRGRQVGQILRHASCFGVTCRELNMQDKRETAECELGRREQVTLQATLSLLREGRSVHLFS